MVGQLSSTEVVDLIESAQSELAVQVSFVDVIGLNVPNM